MNAGIDTLSDAEVDAVCGGVGYPAGNWPATMLEMWITIATVKSIIADAKHPVDPQPS